MPSRYVYKKKWKRAAASIFDFLGSCFYRFLSPNKTSFDPASVERILIIRLDHIGDAVMTRPAIRAVAQHFPHAKIDLLLSSDIAPLFELEPGIHQIISASRHWFSRDAEGLRKYQEFFSLSRTLESAKYDLGIDFRGDLRNIFLMTMARIPFRLAYTGTGGAFMLSHAAPCDRQLHQVDASAALLRKIGINSEPENHSFNCPADKTALLESRFPFLAQKDCQRVVMHLSAGYPSKRWPADRYRFVISRLLHRPNLSVILIGTKKDKIDISVPEYSGRVFDLRGLLQLEDLPLLFERCDLYIGGDSGPAHIAATQNIPGVIIFSGANDSRVWRPWSSKLQILTHPVPCSPCESQECVMKHLDCLESISADQVLRAVDPLLPLPIGHPAL